MPSGTFSGRSNFRLDLNVWQGPQDIGANTTTVYWELWLVNTGGAWSGSQFTSRWSASIDGRDTGGTFTFGLSGGQSMKLGGGQVGSTHNADGSKRIGFSASVSADVIGNAGAGGEMDLSMIARASQATFSPSEHTLVAGEPVYINTNRRSTTFHHVIAWHWGNRAQNIGEVNDQIQWVVPFDFIQEMPNTLTATGHIEVSTWQGDRWIGTTTSPFRVHVPIDKAQPKIKTVTATDQNPTVVSAIGAFVQGESLLKIDVTSEAIMGASIVSQWFSVDGQTAQSGQTASLPNAGTRSVGVSVQESRGITASETRSVEVMPYAPPALAAVVQRAKSDGTVNQDEGTYLRLDLNAVAQSLVVGGVEKNALKIAVETRERNQAQWTARNVIAPAGLTFKQGVLVSGGGVFDITKSYDVRVTVSDKLRTGARATTFEASLSTAEIFMDWSNGLGVLKYHEKGAIDAGGEIYHRFGSLVEPVGIMVQFGGLTAPAGWLICDGRTLDRSSYPALFATIGIQYGAGNGSTTFGLPDLRDRVPVGYRAGDADFGALGRTGGARTHTLSSLEIPPHVHALGGHTYAWGDQGSVNIQNAVAVGGAASGNRLYTWQNSWDKTSNDGGGGRPHNNMQPFITVNYIIKAF
ncbi:microcystin-dependent protein [Microbacterium testaceum]|uniref:DUF859 family phage minor structural protein n=1 Tax=Microbacterium TaxID=33882 RepID=UPI00278B52E8|nr:MULTISPECIES: DUF859 family phage minor structural protein [Microbacterium]MDQ1113926.1 microcystin-dependent protein [Microbacterium testaceum]MDR6098967.1 microcystin-dependent protein [Microbacterium sp. SORGH_AS_0454]